MDQVALAIQDSIDRIGHIPANLSHPQPIRDGRDASNLHLARGQLDKEQNEESLQPSSGPHFHRRNPRLLSAPGRSRLRSPVEARTSYPIWFRPCRGHKRSAA